MNEAAFDPAEEQYVSLVTYRRSGVAVAAPVWSAREGAHYYVFSEGKAGKVKRLRNNSHIRMAACDIRGNVSGTWAEGSARVVDDSATIERAYRALRTKYGWMMKVGDFFSKLSGRYARRAMIQIEMDLDA
ncbi:MAG TPA: PPOX class F420-dependent oxidoreductase [Gammaproteobacteria bacterium]|nr:PPOX class F420-dependent oxidoreductase [Gammaproteobacteria bacterium]